MGNEEIFIYQINTNDKFYKGLQGNFNSYREMSYHLKYIGKHFPQTYAFIDNKSSGICSRTEKVKF